MTKSQGKWRLFAFHPMDYKAAERWLGDQAAAGWRADRFALRGLVVHLAPTDRTDLKYCVDITDRKHSDSAEYAKLCRDSGWTWLDRVGQGNVYASRPGEDPPSIQTDGGLEEERFLQKYARRTGAELAVCAAVLAFAVLMTALFWPGLLLSSLRSMREFLSLANLALLILLYLWQLTALLRYERAARSSVRSGGGMPARSRRQARSWAVFVPLVLLLWALLVVSPTLGAWLSPTHQTYGPDRRPLLRNEPVVMAEDLGLDAGRIGGSYFESDRTPFLSYHCLLDPLGSLRTHHYRFASASLARWGAGVLLKDAEEPLGQVELGFDESWTGQNELGNRTLLLRQGETVVLLSGEVDWTAPEVREMLWERLDLTK